MKKFLFLSLALIIALSSFAGCGKKETGVSPYNPNVKYGDTGGLTLPLTDSTEELTWSVNSPTSTDDTLNNSFVVTKLREMTGVNVKMIVFPTSTANEKIKILAASKQLPDIVGQGLDEKIKNELCLQGAFASIEDYIDILPNFKAKFVDGDAKWVFNSYKMGDGKLYGYFPYDWQRDVNTGVNLYRKDIFEKNNIPMWTNSEEFYQALKKLKEIYPDSIPYTVKTADGTFRTWSYQWGMFAHYPYYDEEAKVWKYTDTDPKYKEMLDFMKKLYDEGLIDPEFLTNTQAVWTSKMTQPEKSFVTTDWIGRLDTFSEQSKDTAPGYDLRFAVPFGPTGKYKENNQIASPKHVSKNKKTETSFKLLDFCFSPAGTELITMGVEGETYVLDENGMAKYIDFTDTKPDSRMLEDKYGMFVEGMYMRFDRRSTYFNFTEREQEAQDFAKNPDSLDKLDPILVFSEEQTAKNAEYLGKLDKAGKEFATKYILGTETGDAAWNKWVKEAERLGSEKLVAIFNEAQKEYNK